MGTFAYPGSETDNIDCPVARAAAKLGISADELQNYLNQQTAAQQAAQQYALQYAVQVQQLQQQQYLAQMMARLYRPSTPRGVQAPGWATNYIQTEGYKPTSSGKLPPVPSGFQLGNYKGTPFAMAKNGSQVDVLRLSHGVMSWFDCFVAGTPVQQDGGSTSTSAVAIERVTVGTRLQTASAATSGEAIDPANWRQVELQALQANGRHTDVTLLRPLSWLREHNIHAGTAATLSIPGYTADTLFTVRVVAACPTIASGQGPVVTGTFRHESAPVVDLFVSGQVEPIGVTAHHRFWSTDRQAFVAVGELKTGEHLSGSNGNVTVLRVVSRPVDEPVYNLEVHGGAVLHVGPAALIAQSVGQAK